MDDGHHTGDPMRAAALTLTALCACAGASDDTDAPADELPYVLPDDAVDEPPAEVDVAALTASVQAAFDAALGLHALPVITAFGAAATDHDEACPPIWTETETALQWYGDCTTEGGTTYAGYALYEAAAVYDETFDGTTTYLYGAGSITTAEGHTLLVGGTAAVSTGMTDEGPSGQSTVTGSFAWDGPDAAGTWLADGTELDLTMAWLRAEWGRYVFFDGAMVPSTGSPVHFSQVAVLDVICPNEPGGMVSVRGPDGWVDVTFDLDLNAPEATPAAACDGCGRATYRGVDVGELCIDVDGLASFGDAPW